METIPNLKFRGRGFRTLYSCSSGDPVVYLSATTGLGSKFWPSWATEKKHHHKLFKPCWMLTQVAESPIKRLFPVILAINGNILSWVRPLNPRLWQQPALLSARVPFQPSMGVTSEPSPAQVSSWGLTRAVSWATMASNTLTFFIDFTLPWLHHKGGEAAYKNGECFPP